MNVLGKVGRFGVHSGSHFLAMTALTANANQFRETQ
jgi:hypothetical protein